MLFRLRFEKLLFASLLFFLKLWSCNRCHFSYFFSQLSKYLSNWGTSFCSKYQSLVNTFCVANASICCFQQNCVLLINSVFVASARLCRWHGEFPSFLSHPHSSCSVVYAKDSPTVISTSLIAQRRLKKWPAAITRDALQFAGTTRKS